MQAQTFTEFDRFKEAWDSHDESYLTLLWQLLARLDDDELLIELPDWLAAEKVGYVDRATPTEFVGRIDRETEKAIKIVDSAAARPLAKLAHRMEHLEQGLEEIEPSDPDRHELLTARLRSVSSDFHARVDVPALQNEWLPKSQILHAVRRS